MTIIKFTGNILSTSDLPRLENGTYAPPSLQIFSEIVVDTENGKILSLIPQGSEEISPISVDQHIAIGNNQILIPGFIDTHTHAPQFLNAGIGYDLELLQWLEKYTFPTEIRCKDVNFASALYEKSVETHLKYGSTTCVYFSTIHLEASLALASICQRKGQRAFIGKVNMDRNSGNYVELSAEDSLRDTRAFVEKMRALSPESNSSSILVSPIITPRFVPTCTDELMKGLGDIAKEYDLAIQSHVSENLGEVQWVKSLYPDSKSYSEVYDRFGLLTDKTILAHGIFLTDEEIKLLKERGTTISHCPLSNFCLQSGNLNVRRLLNAGVNVSIGTDVSGGYSASMLNAIQNTLIASAVNRFAHRDIPNVDKQVHDLLNNVEQKENLPTTLTTPELLYMSTLAGAKSLKIDHVTGSFEIGKEFDALLVDIDSLPISNPESDSIQDKLQRFFMLGDDRQISSIWVQGKQVKSQVN